MKVDYSNCKIYKLIDTINNCFYIGSTCDTLGRRLSLHKINARKHEKTRVYKYFNEIGFENVKIILIEVYPNCKNKDDQRREEQKYIDLYWNDTKCLNSINAFTSKESAKEYHKEYMKTDIYKKYLEKYEKTEERKKQHREFNKTKIACVCGSIYNQGDKSQHLKTKKHQAFL